MTIIAIMLIIPFIARKEGFIILIIGKLKIPAIIAIKPIIMVVKWVMLFEVNPLERDFNFFIFASIINPAPIISIRKDSMYSLESKLKKLWLITPENPSILTIASAVTNFCDTLTFPLNLFFII